MPIILVCGDVEMTKIFCEDFSARFNKTVTHTTPFSEAISDVIEGDTSFNHLVTLAYHKPERYIASCHARRFKTAYLVVFLDGDLPDMLEMPKESTRHDNPLILSKNYINEDKEIFLNEIEKKIYSARIKKSFSNHKVLRSSEYLRTVKDIVKKIQSNYPYDEEIAIETENRLMNMITQSKKDFDAESVYEEILKDALRERGIIE